jgi:hypothetical protein
LNFKSILPPALLPFPAFVSLYYFSLLYLLQQTLEMMMSIFAEQGKVELISVPKDKNALQPRWFCVCRFRMPVQAAVDALMDPPWRTRIQSDQVRCQDQVEKKEA